MKKVDVYEIIIKTFGLIFLYEGVFRLEYLITTIISIYQLQSAKGDAAFSSFIAIGTTSITVLLYFLIYGGLFYFFFFKTSKLIKLVAKGDDYTTIVTPFLDRKSTYKLISVILGLVLIVNSIPICVSLINEKILAVQSDFTFATYKQSTLIINVVKTFIGCTLVIGAETFAVLFDGKSKKT